MGCKRIGRLRDGNRQRLLLRCYCKQGPRFHLEHLLDPLILNPITNHAGAHLPDGRRLFFSNLHPPHRSAVPAFTILFLKTTKKFVDRCEISYFCINKLNGPPNRSNFHILSIEK